MEDSLSVARRDVDIEDMDNTSCCSGDTVLSVGQESPSPAMAYRGIHTHLSAISQITHDLRNGASLMLAAAGGCGRGDRSPLSPHTPQSPRSLQSPRSTNSPHSPASSPSPRATEPLPDPNENNNLKFSIDNILKADFGRRITDSLKSRSAAKNKALLAAARAHHRQSTAAAGSHAGQDSDGAPNSRNDKSGSIQDLSLSADSTRTSSSDSGGPMVWPAWVYCTRYSDRPSSGIVFLIYIKTFIKMIQHRFDR